MQRLQRVGPHRPELSTRTRAIAVLATVAAAMVAGTTPGVGALEQEAMTIREGEVVEATYGPIPGNNAALTHYPDECATSTYCDVVPLDVIVPDDLQPGDDFVVKLTMSWPEQAADTPGYRGSSNDLDMYVYDNKQTQTENPPEDGSEPSYEEKTSGASDQNPEVAQLFRPTLGRYNIVVNNFLGTNVGYTIKLEWQSFDVDPAMELLAPPPDDRRRTTTTISRRPATTTAPSAASTSSTTAVIPEGVVLPDDDFDSTAFGGGGGGPTADDLSALGESQGPLRRRDLGSPSPLTLVLWMVVLPAVLGGVFVLVMRRRRRGRGARNLAAT